MSQFLNFGLGNDGIWTPGTVTDTPIDSSCSGTVNTTSLSATNTSFEAGQQILIHQTRGTGVGNWEVNFIASYVAGTITTLLPLSNTSTDSGASQAQVLVLKQYSSVTIAGTLTGKTWSGDVGGILAFVCSGTTSITGTATANGTGFAGGLGNNNSNTLGNSGEGTAGASVVNSSAANGNGGGGGKSGGGGPQPSGGGNGAAGGGDNGGAIVGNAALTLMDLGGGSGGRGMDNPTANDGISGGGIILIFSKILTITGAITANGSDGQTNAGAGGGGSIFLKGQTITLGNNLITASGGTPGNGGAGGAGRIRVEVCSRTGVTNPLASESVGGFNFCGGAVAIL